MNNKKDFLKQIISDTGIGIKGYMKAQFKLMFITFIILSIGLTIIAAPHPILISAGISILDIIPVLGAGIVMIPWSIISFIVGNKDMGANIAIIYVVLVIVRQFIEPKIVGKEIGVRPLYTFIATILGAMILGPIGVILGPLIAIVINSIIKIKKR
ncbi:AI-2E family transporter [Tissierella sp.]|uniref:AI-2E family transporter n=1 Tax=Tissierella sp. TaxID=41274 RepID=UPI00285860A4|nr:AI-2E family transporter [Tissierella sp.]MDR7856665.1 AI-2E family transporter [Tissierella sp.]